MKNKYILKLICIAAALLLTVSVLVASTYAWFTLSTDPTVSGIAIAISGSNTIQFAPNLTLTDPDGNVLHYPGAFSGSMSFSEFDTYDYLNNISSLTPVSTADGVNWFFPSYYTDSADLSTSGGLKKIDDFLLDNSLKAANSEENGTYVYVDFWVLSPTDDFSLRVSTADSGDDGSFVLAMPQIKAREDGSLYLAGGDAASAASMRLGFLVNTEESKTEALNWYRGVAGFDTRVNRLQGIYTTPGEYYWSAWNRFTIYEPNGDWHDPERKSYVHGSGGIVSAAYPNGSYVKTYPIGLDAGFIRLEDTTSITAVQKTNQWILRGDHLMIDEQFQAYNLNNKYGDLTPMEILGGFSRDYMQGQFDHYVQRGSFIRSSAALSGAADSSGVVRAEDVQKLAAGGAVDDVTITRLEAGVAQRVRMFIWLEGQDVDCVTHQEVWNTIIRLEFAGGD